MKLGRVQGSIVLGNDRDLVGRFFQLHLEYQYARIPEVDALMRIIHRTDGFAGARRDLEAVARQLLGVAAYSAGRMLHGQNKPPVPMASIPLNCTSEPMPNPERDQHHFLQLTTIHRCFIYVLQSCGDKVFFETKALDRSIVAER